MVHDVHSSLSSTQRSSLEGIYVPRWTLIETQPSANPLCEKELVALHGLKVIPRMIFSSLVALSVLSAFSFTGVHASNDWSQPCLDGTCEYDLPNNTNGARGTVRVWGRPDAISDITTAAGWVILGCDSDAMAQDIRLVCSSDEAERANRCEHLFRGAGARGKIVRLPENCGKNPFAHVAKAWVSEDQRIPTEFARHVYRRDGAAPEVQALTLDTDFEAIDVHKTGTINIAVAGSTFPGEQGDSILIPPPFSEVERRNLVSRGLWDWIEDQFEKFNNFDKNITKDLPPVNINKNLNLFDLSISCPASGGIPAFSAHLRADAAARADVYVTLGVAAAGTIVPPKIDAIGIFANMDAALNGNLKLVGGVSGTADSGLVTLFQTGLPGLDFPGLLTLGPSFKVVAQATAFVDVDVDLSVDLSYTVDDARLFFPKSDRFPSGGIFYPINTPLKLSASPVLTSRAVVTARVSPRIDMGINALGGIATATVFLNVDADAQTTLTLNANANADLSITPTTPAQSSASGQISGCIDIGAGLGVNAGADANFFGLFDRSTVVPLYNKRFNLLNRCFSRSGSTKREDPPLIMSSLTRRAQYSALRPRALSCPLPSQRDAVPVANELVLGSSIKPIA